MVGLIIPQFQHDIIPLNSVVCLQDVNYRHDAAPVRTTAPIHEKDTESRDILMLQQIYAHFKAKNKICIKRYCPSMLNSTSDNVSCARMLACPRLLDQNP